MFDAKKYDGTWVVPVVGVTCCACIVGMYVVIWPLDGWRIALVAIQQCVVLHAMLWFQSASRGGT